MASNSTSAVSHAQCLPKTSSRCITPTFTSTHDFEISSYPLLEGIGVERLVSSTVFSVGGFNWVIYFFPDGVRNGGFGNASAFLNCLSPEMDVRARFTLNLLGKDGVQVTKYEEVEDTFSSECVYLGYPQFVDRSRLRSVSLENNGSFIIRCVLTVIGEPYTEGRHVIPPSPPLPILRDSKRSVMRIKGAHH
ncbi:BTB/POZ and MATH domain-containing protein 2-like [Triticum aestivum]|uniref:BTB/POZ and MATH domain-containing protein 2-like n=1 Tax=Triticum aestivum TaxID=4565 RepID=UPI001D00A144|nr:BTB/POZ and MATH domain-containing protein 2-like [Triticum aestivum]